MKRVFNPAVLIAMLLLVLGLSAHASNRGPFGGEDPFPFSCFNFSGSWIDEEGDEYRIKQKGCARLEIVREFKGSHEAQRSTIVPDNRSRKVTGGKWKGQVRHRWNAKKYGATVETYREMFNADHRISEVVLLESVNESLILETMYRTVEITTPAGTETKSENYQRMFRRAKPASVGEGPKKR